MKLRQLTKYGTDGLGTGYFARDGSRGLPRAEERTMADINLQVNCLGNKLSVIAALESTIASR